MLDITLHRLYNQHLSRQAFHRPEDVVQWMGAVQAQDYLGSLWAIGLRLPGSTEDDIEQAIAKKSIIRTWPMRGTLHFVNATDIRWMLELLAPRIISNGAARLKQLGLDDATFIKSKKLVEDVLQGGNQLSRDSIYKLLEDKKISTAGQRGIHILWRLAQEGLICFGTREGKQQTFVLLDEWIPKTKTLHRDEALAELAKRYFTSHGPATIQDFIWWSGLKASEAKTGLDMVKSELEHLTIDDHVYWLAQFMPDAKEMTSTAYLLPAFDEYLIGYKDRSAALDPTYTKQVYGILSPTIVVNGQVIGTWRRSIKKDKVFITAKAFTKLNKAENRTFLELASLYGQFLKMAVIT